MINEATTIANILIAIESPARVGTGVVLPEPGVNVAAIWATCPGWTVTEPDQSLYPPSCMLTM